MHDEDHTRSPRRQPEQLSLESGLASEVLVALHERAAAAGLVGPIDWRGWIAEQLERGFALRALRIEAAAYARADLVALLAYRRRRVRSADLARHGGTSTPSRRLRLFAVHEPDLAALELAVDELVREQHERDVRARRAAIAMVGTEARDRVRRRKRW